MINEKYEEGLRKADDWANVLRAVYHSAYDECSREYLRKPPQRPWQELTDEEILADGVLGYHFGKNGGAGPVSATGKAIVEVVSAMLKERNT